MAPTNLPPPQDPSQRSPAKPPSPESHESGSDHHMRVIGLMIGTALMFIGFLNVFLSISGGFEINVVPFFHYGEVLFWHKQVVFWVTVLIVMYFMFNEPKKPG
jgi:hypothetical protein